MTPSKPVGCAVWLVLLGTLLQVHASAVAAATAFDFTLYTGTLYAGGTNRGGDQSVIAGYSVTIPISAIWVSGLQPVNFSVSGAPGSSSFSQMSCTPTCITSLIISTTTATAAGAYPITVSATGGGVTRTTQFTLTVMSGTAAFDYSLRIGVPRIVVAKGGGYGTRKIDVTLLSGAPEAVTLSAAGMPTGVTVSFTENPTITYNPCTPTPTCSIPLRVTVGASVPVGIYPITVTGTPLGKTTSVTLEVADVSVSVPLHVTLSSTGGTPGQSVTVGLSQVSAPDRNTSSLSLEISYDATKFNVPTYTNSSAIEANESTVINTATAGKVGIVITDRAEATDPLFGLQNGELLKLTFPIKPGAMSGTFPLPIVNATALDRTGAGISPIVTANGAITVTGSTPAPTVHVTLANATGQVGQEVTLSLSQVSTPLRNASIISLDLGYDPTQLALKTYATGSALESDDIFSVNSFPEGTINLIISSMSNMAPLPDPLFGLPDGELFRVTFTIKTTATPGTTPLSITNLFAEDGAGNFSAVTQTNGAVTVTSGDPPPNEPPVAGSDQTISTPEGIAKTISLIGAALDPNGDPLTYTIVSGPANGTLTNVVLSGTDPAVTYTPRQGFTGTDTFSFKANDGKVDSNVGTMTILVTPLVQGSVAVTLSSASGASGQSVTVSLSHVSTLARNTSTLSLDIAYDATKSNVPTYTNGSAIEANEIPLVDTTIPGKVGIIVADLAKATDPIFGLQNGELLKLTFLLKTGAFSGTIPLPIANLVGLDRDGVRIVSITKTDGAIIISGLRGDLDGNGTVNLEDLRRMIYMLVGTMSKDLLTADLDGDGSLLLVDLQALVKILVGIP